QPVQSTTQTRDPWSGVQPMLSSMYNKAENMRAAGEGYAPYEGQTVAPLNQNINDAMGWLYGYNNQMLGDPGLTAPRVLANEMLQNHGLSPDQQRMLGNIQGIADTGLNQSNNYYQQIAGLANNEQRPTDLY